MGVAVKLEEVGVIVSVTAGEARDVHEIAVRLREYLRYRQSATGPTVFEPDAEARDVWEWAAKLSQGSSCRACRLLDRVVQMILWQTPHDGRVYATVFRPSRRTVVTSETPVIDSATAFVSLHLRDTVQVGFANVASASVGGGRDINGTVQRAPEGMTLDCNLSYVRGFGGFEPEDVISGRWHWLPEGLDFLADDDDEDFDEGEIRFGLDPFDGNYVQEWRLPVDWLDLLFRGDLEVPENGLAEREAWERLAPARDALCAAAPPEWRLALAQAVDVLVAASVRRTAAFQRVFPGAFDFLPSVEPMRLGLPVEVVTFADMAPELLLMEADEPMEHCRDCPGRDCGSRDRQLALDDM